MIKQKHGSVLLFDRHKYTWLVIGLGVTAVGFLLMIGGKSDDPTVFSEDIFSFRRLTLAPILVLAGYVMQIYAIMKKSTNKPEEPKHTRPHHPSHKKQQTPHERPKQKRKQ